VANRAEDSVLILVKFLFMEGLLRHLVIWMTLQTEGYQMIGWARFILGMQEVKE